MINYVTEPLFPKPEKISPAELQRIIKESVGELKFPPGIKVEIDSSNLVIKGKVSRLGNTIVDPLNPDSLNKLREQIADAIIERSLNRIL